MRKPNQVARVHGERLPQRQDLSRRGFLGLFAATVGIGLTPAAAAPVFSGIDLAVGPDYVVEWVVAPLLGGVPTVYVVEDVARIFNVPVDLLGPRS